MTARPSQASGCWEAPLGLGAEPSGDLAIDAGKTIFFDPESGESDYAHSLSGEGTVFMSGSGTINLTGDSSGFTGTLFLTNTAGMSAGTLNVDGTIAPTTLGIESGATLGGGDSILGTATASSGTIRPEAAAPRLRVDDVVSGSGFSSLDLPDVPGMTWDTGQVLTTGVLSITVDLPGEYNLDGVVDAADYTAWRDYLNEPAGALPSDIDEVVIGQAQYDTWIAHFGQGVTTKTAAVPEPGALVLLAGFLAATHAAEQRRPAC